MIWVTKRLIFLPALDFWQHANFSRLSRGWRIQWGGIVLIPRPQVDSGTVLDWYEADLATRPEVAASLNDEDDSDIESEQEWEK